MRKYRTLKKPRRLNRPREHRVQGGGGRDYKNIKVVKVQSQTCNRRSSPEGTRRRTQSRRPICTDTMGLEVEHILSGGVRTHKV